MKKALSPQQKLRNRAAAINRTKPLKAQGIISIIGDITSDSYAIFSAALAEHEEKGAKVLHVELYSEGGDDYAGLAFAARMRLSSCRFIVTAFGQVSSAAVIIFISGVERRMTKESWMMCHESSDDHGSISRTEAKQIASHMDDMEHQWASLLTELCPRVSWLELHQQEDRWLSAKQCQALGITHKII